MSVEKIVLAYSGGLDTSVILKWLSEEYQCPVVAFAADVGYCLTGVSVANDCYLGSSVGSAPP